MTEQAERYATVADGFGDRVRGVAEWNAPTPCEGWVARDVVDHVVGWFPGLFFDPWGLQHPEGPSVADDPVGAWGALDAAVRAALADPAVAASEREIRPGTFPFEQAVATFGTPDLLVHTWDLARATGQDESLDPAAVHELLEGMSAMLTDEMRGEQFGPAVPVPDDADEQTRLIAFTGRTP